MAVTAEVEEVEGTVEVEGKVKVAEIPDEEEKLLVEEGVVIGLEVIDFQVGKEVSFFRKQPLVCNFI